MLDWLYLDLNSYFASCEQQARIELRDRPVGIVPMFTDTTCILAASYEAKAHGIKTGTSVADAKRLCPEIKLVLSRHKLYVEYHHQILQAIESCIPIDDVYSIDEVACRLTSSQREPENAVALAIAIKKAIRSQVGECLTSSVGIAPNRFLAKVATDMQKPNGLVVIRREDLPAALLPLSIRDLPGIGPGMEARLNKAGIHSMQSLWLADKRLLKRVWGGVEGVRFYAKLHGEAYDTSPTQTRSLSHQHVLEPEYRSAQGGLEVLRQLLTKAAERMRQKGYYCRALGVQVKFTRQMGYWEHGQRFAETQDTRFLLKLLHEMWKDYPPSKAPLRVGVVLADLVPCYAHQFGLFQNPKEEKLLSAIDTINARFGKHAVSFGLEEVVKRKLSHNKIAFQRVPGLDEWSGKSAEEALPAPDSPLRKPGV